MKIFIVGLGLIGASYAEGLSKKHTIYAWNRTEQRVLDAINEDIVAKDNDLSKLSEADLIILSLYPKHNIEFVKSHQALFKFGQIVTDVSGTKQWMIHEIEKVLPKGVSYTSHHPMAGKETSGYAVKDATIFKGANFIIVKSNKSIPEDEIVLRSIANDLSFGRIIVVDAKTHDELIAFTSQLTHILAISLVNADTFKETKEATGDSYRDLTRIAKINATMWSELFGENKKALLEQIKKFEQQLDYVKDMILNEDKEALIAYMEKATEKRKTFDADSNEKL